MIFYNHRSKYFETCWLDIYCTSDHVKGWQFDKITKIHLVLFVVSLCTLIAFPPHTWTTYATGIFHQWAKTKSICVNSYPSYCPHCYIFSVRLSRIESYSQITLSISCSLSRPLSLSLNTFVHSNPHVDPIFTAFFFLFSYNYARMVLSIYFILNCPISFGWHMQFDINSIGSESLN